MSLTGFVGQRLGRWTLSKKLGSGGFGAAWLASDDNGQEAALKILPGPPGGEARALARICHPAVPALLDAQGGAHPFLCMELAPGRTLTRMIKAGRAPDKAAITVLAVLADALSAVHVAGLVHGDIKPDNVIIDSVAAGKMMIVDFGVAGTGEGGTLLYAAPERLGGAGPSTESDVYSLGLSLWEMLHSQLPWAELGPSMALLKRRGPPPDPTEGPAWLKDLVVQMLAFETANRPKASDIADACAAHGAKIPAPGPDLLRIRASAVHIPSAPVEQEIQQWREHGGTLAVVGLTGAGRTHTLDRITVDLKADGMSVLRLVATGEPWGSIRLALTSPRDRAHQCLRAALAPLLRGQSIPFPVNLTVSRPDKGLAAGRTRSIYVRPRDSIASVAHPSLPVAPLQDASSFGLLFPGCWRSSRGQSQRREHTKRRRRAHDRPEHHGHLTGRAKHRIR